MDPRHEATPDRLRALAAAADASRRPGGDPPKRTPLATVLKQAGAPAFFDRIDLQALAAVLDANPAWVEAWLAESEDQRGTPAWALGHDEHGWYVVYVPRVGPFDRPLRFPSAGAACASFIVRHAPALLW